MESPTLSQRTRKDGAPSGSEEIKGWATRRRPDFTLSVVEGLPHTFACSTIGPAGLNLRRLAGVRRSGSPQPKSRAFCARDLFVRAECMEEIDITGISFDSFVSFMFDRPVPAQGQRQRWYWTIEATFDPARLTSYYVSLFSRRVRPCNVLPV
jgi:hypothetical protein